MAAAMTCLPPERVQDFLGGRLGGAELDAIDLHLDRCASCRQLTAGAARLLASSTAEAAGAPSATGAGAPPRRGELVGRYVVLDPIGRGGMGQVWSAFDGELERRVALKLLDGAGGGEAVDRLRREAQAMARVSHPQVVQVHELVARGDDLVLAMELVEGTTLEEWQREARPWRAVVEAYLHAARGLAAAHRAGVVHGDVKPHNVLVARDGRVAVTDFGLARTAGRAAGPVGGTPAYMAPEIHRGEPATGASDQFSLCVSLHEALHGARPFAGETAAELAEAIAAGRIGPPRRRVPAAITRAIGRGLRPDPADRHGSMDELVRALERAVARRPGRWLVAAGALAAAAGLTFAVGRGTATDGGAGAGHGTMCRAGEAQLAGAWDDTRRERLTAALAAGGPAYAGEAARRAVAALDRHAAAWVAAYTDACEATRVRGEQSEALLDRRMECLARRRGELDALAAALEAGGAAVLEHAVSAAHGLRPVSSCEAGAVGGVAPPPAPLREQVTALDAALARADALERTGDLRGALEAARTAAAQAGGTGYPPIAARAGYLAGFLEILTGELDAGRARLRDAVAAAQAAGDDDTAGQAAAALVHAAVERGDADDARAWAAFARASSERRGGDPVLAAKVHQYEGNLWRRGGDGPRAIESYRAALAALEPALGPAHPGLVSAQVGLGAALLATGDVAGARASYERAAEMARALGGPDHPMVGFPLNGLGNALVAAGELERAAAVQAETLRIWTAAFGPRHARVASALGNAAVLDLHRGAYQEALAGFEQVLAIQQETLGAEHPRTALTVSHIGNTLLHLDRADEARARLEQAAALQERALGAEHPELGATLAALGALRCAAGEPAGEPLLRQALAIGEARRHARLELAALIELGDCLVRRGRARAALPLLERALAGEKAGAPREELARLRFALARALVASGGDDALLERAGALAREAREALAGLGDGRAAPVDRWLAAQPVIPRR